MSHPIGPVPLPSPQTLDLLLSEREPASKGRRLRYAAFFLDFAAIVLLLGVWSTDRQFFSTTALWLGGAAVAVSAAAVWRSAPSTRAIGWVWLGVAALIVAAGLFAG